MACWYRGIRRQTLVAPPACGGLQQRPLIRRKWKRRNAIAKLWQGIASCEEFFNEWEVRGAPASISTIVALAREAVAAKDCIDKGEATSACKHWQGLLVEIEQLGLPVSETRGEIKELMRQNRCASN